MAKKKVVDEIDELEELLEDDDDLDEDFEEEVEEEEVKPKSKKSKKAAVVEETVVEETEEDFVDDTEDDDFEEEVEEAPVVEAPKKKGKKTVKVEAIDEAGEEVEAEIEDEEPGDELLVQDDAEFDPKTDGIKAGEMFDRLSSTFIEYAPRVGNIIRKAKKHFKGNKEELEKWLRKYTKMSYSTACMYVKIGKWNPETIEKIQELGFSSTHVKSLPALGKEEAIVEFLEKKTHVVDEEGTKKKTAEMTPQELQSAVKQERKKNGKERAEPAPHELFDRSVKKLDSFFNGNLIEFNQNLIIKAISPDGQDEETGKRLKNLVKVFKTYAVKLEKLAAKFN